MATSFLFRVRLNYNLQTFLVKKIARVHSCKILSAVAKDAAKVVLLAKGHIGD